MPESVANNSNELMISPQHLMGLLSDKSESVVVLDCRFSLADSNLGKEEFSQGHIPTAYYCDLEKDLSSPVAKNKNGGRHPLPNQDALARLFSGFGIHSAKGSNADQQTLVVVYDNSRFAFAARCWWLLGWLGHERVKFLDGGFAAWQAAGLSVSTEITSTNSEAAFEVKPPKSQLFTKVDHEVVSSISTNRNSRQLIDSREEQRYLGNEEPIDPIAGHIPGARCFPWQEVSGDDGSIRSKEFHEERWQQVNDQNDELIVYCGSGVTACVNLLSMRIAGIQNARLYPGSWSDWCSRGLPVGLGSG